MLQAGNYYERPSFEACVFLGVNVSSSFLFLAWELTFMAVPREVNTSFESLIRRSMYKRITTNGISPVCVQLVYSPFMITVIKSLSEEPSNTCYTPADNPLSEIGGPAADRPR